MTDFRSGDRVTYTGTVSMDRRGRFGTVTAGERGGVVGVHWDDDVDYGCWPRNLEIVEAAADEPKNATFSIDFKKIYEDDDLELWSVTPRRTKVVYTIRKGAGGARNYRADVVIPHDTGVWAEAGVKDALHHIILGECYKKDIR